MSMRSFLLRTVWLPPAVWVGVLVYLERYDGWGAWAAAPLLLPALALGLAWGIVGLVELFRDAGSRRPFDWPVVTATLISASPLLYYILRNLLSTP